jgi:hypothetical protein
LFIGRHILNSATMTTFRFFLLACAISCAGTSDDAGAPDRRATLVPELRIDGMAEDLVAIHALAVYSDGKIVFTQARDGQLRVYSESGEPLGRIGSRGQGPGEFLNPNRLGWHHDSLWVYDGRQERISLVTPEHQVARTISSVPGAASPRQEDAGRIPEFPFAYLRGITPDGSFLVSMGFAVNQPLPDQYVGRSVIGRIDQERVVQGIVAVLPRPEGGYVTTPEGASATVPFGNSPQMAFSPNGSMVAFAKAFIDGPNAGQFQMTAFSEAGDTIFARTYGLTLDPIPATVSDSTRAALISSLERVDASLAAAVRDAFIPSYYPPLDGLVIGMDGTLWVQKRPSTEGVRILAAEPDGGIIGELILPVRSRIAAATRDRLWVIEADDVGVESIVRYKVVWE